MSGAGTWINRYYPEPFFTKCTDLMFGSTEILELVSSFKNQTKRDGLLLQAKYIT